MILRYKQSMLCHQNRFPIMKTDVMTYSNYGFTRKLEMASVWAGDDIYFTKDSPSKDV